MALIYKHASSPIVIVCIPGLMGGPSDFAEMAPLWQTEYSVYITDPNEERQELGINKLTEDVVQEISFDASATVIRDALLLNFPGSKFYFVGISLGGKIIFDFAIKFPENFLGAVITDVGPESFDKAPLFQAVYHLVKNADMSLPWHEMKQHLQTTIPDKSLRILIQSQLHYPEQKPPAVWKTAMENFKRMLQRQSIDEQQKDLAAIDGTLASENKFIYVLKADHLSGISQSCLEEMEKLECIKLVTVQSASHFMHVTNKDDILAAVKEMISLR